VPQEGHICHGDIATASHTLQANKTYMVMAKSHPFQRTSARPLTGLARVRYSGRAVWTLLEGFISNEGGAADSRRHPQPLQSWRTRMVSHCEINFWDILAFLVFLLVSVGVGIVAVLLLRALRFRGRLTGPATTRCPFCAEIVMAEAHICKLSGRDMMISSRSDVCAECRRPLPWGSSRRLHCHVRV
jgi:hypothetical protein